MPFEEVVALVESLGFRLEAVNGGRRTFRHPDVPQAFTLEAESGKAQPWQVGELLEILDRYDLPGTCERASEMAHAM